MVSEGCGEDHDETPSLAVRSAHTKTDPPKDETELPVFVGVQADTEATKRANTVKLSVRLIMVRGIS